MQKANGTSSYAVIVDETTGISKTEQMSMYLGYVDINAGVLKKDN